MSTIHLHSPATSNAGAFLDAGTDVAIGNGKTQIDADRANELVNSHRAVRVASEGGSKRTVKPKGKRSTPKPVETAEAPVVKTDGDAEGGEGLTSNA